MSYTAQPTGVLASLVDRIQFYANEPATSNKWSAYNLYRAIKANYKELIGEIYRLSQNRPVVQYTITASASTPLHVLPANVGVIERIMEIDDATLLPARTVYSRSRDNFGGPVFRLEGNILRWLPKWVGEDVTLVIEYAPNGDLDLATGSVAYNAAGNSASTLALTTAPTDGYFDRRPYVFRGNRLRLLSGATPSGYAFFPIQDRLVGDYDPSVPKLTVVGDFDFNPTSLGSGTITYEVVPEHLEPLSEALAFRTAKQIHAVEGAAKKAELLLAEYNNKMRDIRLAITSLDAQRGDRYEHDTYNLRDLWGAL